MSAKRRFRPQTQKGKEFSRATKQFDRLTGETVIRGERFDRNEFRAMAQNGRFDFQA
jgi:hypothetical protein